MFHRTKGWNSSLEMKSFFIDRSDGWWPQNSENHEPHLACPAGSNYYHYRLQLFGKDLHISRARDSFDCSHFTCEHMRQKEEKQQRDLTTTNDERRTKCGGGSATGFRIVHLENFSSLHSTSFLVFFFDSQQNGAPPTKEFFNQNEWKKVEKSKRENFLPILHTAGRVECIAWMIWKLAVNKQPRHLVQH